MKRIKLFEAFVKAYGEKIKKEEFKHIAVGSTVKYMTSDFTVEESDGVILILKHAKSGKKIQVNYNMFNEKGAIVSNS